MVTGRWRDSENPGRDDRDISAQRFSKPARQDRTEVQPLVRVRGEPGGGRDIEHIGQRGGRLHRYC
jgi:hypothetical protein